MGDITRVFNALLTYDKEMQRKRDSAMDPEDKMKIEVERQGFYGYISGFSAGCTSKEGG